MDPVPEECYFSWKFNCQAKKEELIPAKTVRIKNIIHCSKIYGDEKHLKLQKLLDDNNDMIIKCHKSCVSSYTSKVHIERHKRKRGAEPAVTGPCKVTRHSQSGGSGECFDFQKHCVFCGEFCSLLADKKHPSRWREAYLFREMNIKASLLDVCEKRNDDASQSVQRRLQGALSDLPAADARYHADCRQRFISFRSLLGQASTSRIAKETDDDRPFLSLVEKMKADRTRMWNSVSLFAVYEEFNGNRLSRRSLTQKLQQTFSSELIVLSSPGIANIIAFRSYASEALKLVNVEDDYLESIATKASNHIIQDVKKIDMNKGYYNISISKDIIKETVSDFLMMLLAKVSPSLDNTLPALLIGSIVTSSLMSQPTCLQIDLAGKTLESKKFINSMYSYGVCCSYTEYRRFKKSASHAALQDLKLSGICNAKEGIVQAIADNFDADISSQNGKQSTHSLAILLTQYSKTPEEGEEETSPKMKRIHKDSPDVPYDIDIHRYQGPKQPLMPLDGATKVVHSLKSLAQQALVVKRGLESNFSFLQDILTQDNCPEFHGYNTKQSREQGHLPQGRTKVVYLPLIDMKPSDPDTMMTAMTKVQDLTSETGQDFSVLTCDQQLYRVAVQVKWAHPEKFKNMHLRLGGIHALMSFVGAVGSLMAESGLSSVLSEAFGGVAKMLQGKKFPQNVRALRMMTEEVLRSLIVDGNIVTADDLSRALDHIAGQSRTAKLWVEVLVKPVLLMLMYIRAEREGDWLLHLHTFRKMLPYYFAAGHFNYARYGLYYLRSMELLPPHIQSYFLEGQHITRHISGIWNGLWSDQFIESTFMKYGHSAGGIIGITLKPNALKIWALSRHICCKIESDMMKMEGERNTSNVNLYHKEESKSRIRTDANDRDKLRESLDTCLHPLKPHDHLPESIVNVTSGKIAPASVNVDNAVQIGETMLKNFEMTWPKGYYSAIPKKVRTMAITMKSIQVDDSKIYDLNGIYSRIIALFSSDRSVDVTDVLAYELAPVPTAMFTEKGMRLCKAKSTLKKSLQVEISKRKAGDADITVIDGSALLWTINWPAHGTIADFIENVKARLISYLLESDVYLIFDRYHEFSIKSVTRNVRETVVNTKHQLLLSTKLPAQKVVLTSTDNKKQLNNLLYEDLTKDRLFHLRSTQKHKLVVTGEDQYPIEIRMEERRDRYDLQNQQEEADTIIVQQVLRCAGEAQHITVVSDDTDVFVLLLHHYHQAGIDVPIVMESPRKERTIVDIQSTLAKHTQIVEHLLPAHAISGCDTVASYYGLGKGSVIKALKDGYDLSAIGNMDAPLQQVLEQATAFISACYGIKESMDMSHTRLLVWGKKMGKGTYLHQIWLLYLQQKKHSLKMLKGPTFKHTCGEISM